MGIEVVLYDTIWAADQREDSPRVELCQKDHDFPYILNIERIHLRTYKNNISWPLNIHPIQIALNWKCLENLNQKSIKDLNISLEINLDYM